MYKAGAAVTHWESPPCRHGGESRSHFLRRLIDLSKVPKALHHFVRLNSEARSDIQWWQAFACRWNGVGLLSALGQSIPSVWIRSDASGGWGCGALCGGAWLQLHWAGELSGLGIAAKEAIPVVLAAFTWGYQWQGKHVVFEVDNSTVVAALRSGSCRDAEVMRLLRLLSVDILREKAGFEAGGRSE